MIKAKVLVLDFDNCLVLDEKTRIGSEEVKDEAWFEVFSEYDQRELGEVIEKAQKQIVGGKGDRQDIVRIICQHFGIPKEKIPAEIELRLKDFNAIVQAGIRRIGVSQDNRQALKMLFQRMPVYLNTATPREQSLESLRALKLEGFKDVYGRPGTKIENLQNIIARESVTPSAVLYVGDQESDWQVAQELGCQFVGVQTSRNTAWQRKPQEFPIVHSLSEILLISNFED